MSEIDTRFDPDMRKTLLAEIRDHLPAFLSSAATEQHDNAGDVRALLNLRQVDLDRLVAVHLGLSDPIRRLSSGLAEGLRRPLITSERPIEMTQAIRGPIDWGATIARRAALGGDRTQYAVRPARRIFDTPENRAFVWLLRRLDALLSNVVAPPADQAEPEELGWMAELAQTRLELHRGLRTKWLSDVRPRHPDALALRRLATSRVAFYRVLVLEAIDVVMRFTEDPSDEDLTTLLAERYFEPRRDWQLFEVVVALRLSRAFAAVAAGRRRSRLLVGVGAASPFARYPLEDGAEVRLWYQGWPPDAGDSLHLAARKRHQVGAGPPRPDLVVQRVGTRPDCLVLELKASETPGYLGEGLAQLLGYLRDRGGFFDRPPNGWLVAPASDAFTDAEPDGELWMVSAAAVADAALERLVA